MEITCFIHRFWVFSRRKYCFGSSFQIYGCLCGCSCWMLWERKKLWLCKILPAMASLLQSITLLFIFSITLILISNRHAIPFIVLHVFSRIASIWRTLGGPYLDTHVRACVGDEFGHSSYLGKMKSWVKI
ncbi:hypothetical protein ES319_1Z210200v1 [Gossypium barbadense]|uniref:Uncharacterized protein n=2 Tax=Gossypium TaxID=3633 RepID=A0A5J5NFU3_GOSBA|nr:hypothetical protein ES319_1Z210200v1 [Gossypium barbadense]TYG81367.1 hypothetical protein ES288_D02G293300v1 [Gossypium darwinii]